jgi:hypothetical protein
MQIYLRKKPTNGLYLTFYRRIGALVGFELRQSRVFEESTFFWVSVSLLRCEFKVVLALGKWLPATFDYKKE